MKNTIQLNLSDFSREELENLIILCFNSDKSANDVVVDIITKLLDSNTL